MPRPSNPPRLRLAPNRVTAPPADALPPCTAAWKLTSLRDAMPAPPWRASAWQALLAGLWPHESLALLQPLPSADAINTTGSSRDETDGAPWVLLHQSPAACAGETRSALPQAMQASLPGWRFTEQPPASVPPLPPLRARLLPASVLALPSAGAADQSAAVAPLWLPMPVALPGWRLSLPFTEPLCPAGGLLVVSFRRRVLQPAERAHLLRQRHVLAGGGLQLRLPDTPTAPPAGTPSQARLVEAVLAQLDALLAAGEGLQCEANLHGEGLFTGFALRRLAADVFGQHPVLQLAPDQTAPLLPWPVLPAQGLPGCFAADACLLAHGVPPALDEPSQLPSGPGVQVGRTGAGRPVLLPDALAASHTLVVGGSGSGKSTLLLRKAVQHMQRGEGLLYIDPHGGDDAFTLLRAVPPARAHEVIVIDPTDPAHVVSLNPLEGTQNSARARDRAAQQIGQLIDTAFETTDSSGPMTRNLLRHALLLAMWHPEGGTLADAARIFRDDGFRDFLVARCGDPAEVAHWRNIVRSHGDHGYDNWRSYLTARLEPFESSAALLATLCQPASVDVADALQRGAIVLLRLPKGELGDTECRLLGMLVLHQFHAAAMRLAAQGCPLVRPFHIIVDEFPSFVAAGEGLATMFRELRKFNLGLCVATQSIDALRGPHGDLATTLLANTAAKLFFRLAPREAHLLDEYTAPEFSARDLARLPNHQAVLSLPAAGVPPLRLATLRPDLPPDGCDAMALRDASGRRHGRPWAAVREALTKRHGLAPGRL